MLQILYNKVDIKKLKVNRYIASYINELYIELLIEDQKYFSKLLKQLNEQESDIKLYINLVSENNTVFQSKLCLCLEDTNRYMDNIKRVVQLNIHSITKLCLNDMKFLYKHFNYRESGRKYIAPYTLITIIKNNNNKQEIILKIEKIDVNLKKTNHFYNLPMELVEYIKNN